MISSKLLKSYSYPTVLSATIAAFSGFNVGWHISVPNMPQTVISKCSGGDWSDRVFPACLPMSDTMWGLSIGIYALGGLAGSLTSGYINGRFSRKSNLMLAGGWMVIGGMLSALSINTVMHSKLFASLLYTKTIFRLSLLANFKYCIGRVFVGISAGLYGSCCGIYVSEISTKQSRGALGCLYELFLNLGILFTQVCGLYMSTVSSWRYLWVIPSILTTVQMILLYFFAVESPRYLCSVGKLDEAKAALFKLREQEDLIEWTELESHILAHASFTTSTSAFELLKDKNILHMILIVCVIQMYNQIGGIGPLSIYSVTLLTGVFQGDKMMATTVTLTSSAGNIVATMVAVVYMHRVGRKGFMLLSTIGMTVASMFLVIGSASTNSAQLAPLSMTAAILFTFTYSMGCGVVPWMIAPELLPLVALPIGSALGNSLNTVWPHMNAGLAGYSFTVFTVINFIGILFVWFFMPETTGKDLDTLTDDESILDIK
ncbi:general substrate transporter [Thamnidium elegans]|nr:general substrate transporter [Thamnidium elegans]